MEEKEKDLNMNESERDEGETLVYEIGFQLIPTISEEEAASAFENIKKLLTDKGAELISEGKPELRDLAYEMSKKIGAKYEKFNKGYFGWVKYAIDRGETVSIQKAIEIMSEVLRFFIIKTVRENTLISQKFQARKQEQEDAAGTPDVVSPEGEVEEASPAALDEEIDKTLEDLEIK